jgi:hypothetical protein
MGPPRPVRRTAVLAFCSGVLAVTCALLALTTGPDLCAVAALVFWVASFVLGSIAWHAIDRAPNLGRGKFLAGFGMILPTVGAVLWFGFVPKFRMVRDTSLRMWSGYHLKQIVDAMTRYAEEHGGRLPPAVLRDRDGRPLYSWRVLLLPYLKSDDLYKEFRLDEPWDSPHNLALLPRRPDVYASPRGLPAATRAGPSGTFYCVFTGPGTAFDGAEGLRLPQDFPDRLDETILVAEAAEPVPWTKPEDLVYDPRGPLPPLGGLFTGGAGCSLTRGVRDRGYSLGLADGSVRFIRDLSETTLRHAITRNDGKALGPDW